MSETEKVALIAGIAAIAWLALCAKPSNNYAQTTASADYSTNVPWYLNYNTTAPQGSFTMTNLPLSSAGIQNQPSGAPCTTCSSLGMAYGSQY